MRIDNVQEWDGQEWYRPISPTSRRRVSNEQCVSLILVGPAYIDIIIRIVYWGKRIVSMSALCATSKIVSHTRGVQKVRRLTQLATTYAYHILSLFNIVSCNWNALGPAFLQSSDSDIEELLFFVFQPAICHAIRMANTVCDWVVQSRHFDDSQCLSWPVIRCVVLAPSDSYLFSKLKELMKGQNFWRRGRYLHDKWLARRPSRSTTILLQRNQSFGETPYKVHFRCRRICWKVTKYDVRIS